MARLEPLCMAMYEFPTTRLLGKGLRAPSPFPQQFETKQIQLLRFKKISEQIFFLPITDAV
jgi:hypothetical protein